MSMSVMANSSAFLSPQFLSPLRVGRSSRSLCKQLGNRPYNGKRLVAVSVSQHQQRKASSPGKSSASSTEGKPLSTENGLLREARRLRRGNDGAGAERVLSRASEQLKKSTEYLNELLRARALSLRAASLHEKIRALDDILKESPAKPDTSSYNVLFAAVRSSVNPSEPHAALDQASKIFAVLRGNKLSPDHFTMSTLLGLCADARDTARAKEFAAVARGVCGYVFNSVSGSALISAFAKSGDAASAENAMKALKETGVEVSDRMYVSLIGMYYRMGHHAQVMRSLKEVLNCTHVQKSIYLFSAAASSCARAADGRGAEFIWNTMKNSKVDLNARVVRSVLDSAARAPNVALGERVLFDSKKVLEGAYVPDRDDFNRLLASCAREKYSYKKRLSETHRLFKRMKEETEFEMDIGNYNVYISTLGKCKAVNDAMYVLENTLPEENIDPNVVTYNSVINACGIVGNAHRAVQLLRPMIESGVPPNQITYNTLLDIAVESGESELVDNIVERLEIDPGVILDAVAITTLLKGCRGTRNADAALKLVNKVRLENMKILDAQVYSSLMNILFDADREKEGISVFGWLLFKRLENVSNFSVVMQYYGFKKYDPERVLMLLQYMKKRNIAPDAQVYAIAIKTCAENRLIDAAFKLLAEMQDVGLGCIDTYAWTALIAGCGRVRQWERALEVLNMMKGEGVSYAPLPTAESYNAAIYAVGMGGGGWTRAQGVWQMLQEDEKVAPNEITYSALASVVLNNWRDDQDLEFVKYLKEKVKEALEDQTKVDLENYNNTLKPKRGRKGKNFKPPPAPKSPSAKKLGSKLKRLERLLNSKENGDGSAAEDVNKEEGNFDGKEQDSE